MKGKFFVTDDREGFRRLIPGKQLHAGKHPTFPIEQDHGNIRHDIARFRRRTKVVAKCEEMVAATLKLYRHYRDRPANLENLLGKTRSIFSQDSRNFIVRGGLNFQAAAFDQVGNLPPGVALMACDPRRTRLCSLAI